MAEEEDGGSTRQDSEVGVVVVVVVVAVTTDEPETEVVLAVINKEDRRPAFGLKDDLISLALLVGCSSDGTVSTVSDLGLVGAETDFCSPSNLTLA